MTSTHEFAKAAAILGNVLTKLRIPSQMVDLVMHYEVSQIGFLCAVMALIFVLGTGLGYLLPRSGGGAQPPPPSPQPPVTTAAAPRTSTAPRPRAVVPPACLETARRADQTIHLLVTNVRTRRLAEALKAYTIASQACREEASP